MGHIFVSYSRQDAAHMQRVHDDLSAAGLAVWTDANLTPGTPSWRDAIEHALEDAAALVVLLSPDAKASPWVERELTYASTCGVTIIPVLVSGSERDAVPFELINAQWIDARTNFDTASRTLISVLGAHVGVRPAPRSTVERADDRTATRTDAQASEPTVAPRRSEPPPPSSGTAAINRQLADSLGFTLDDLRLNRQGQVSQKQRKAIEQARIRTAFGSEMRRLWDHRDVSGCLTGPIGAFFIVVGVVSGAAAAFDLGTSTPMAWLLLGIISAILLGITAYKMQRFKQQTLDRDIVIKHTTGRPLSRQPLGVLSPTATYSINDVRFPKPKDPAELNAFKAHGGDCRLYYVEIATNRTHFLSMEAVERESA